MFSGLIETVGKINSISNQRNYKVISIVLQNIFDAIQIGESIAIDGTCLTVISFDSKSFTVEASIETINRTILGEYQTGINVNLERALKFSDRLGGHMVSGHIDDKGTVTNLKSVGESITIGIEYDKSYDNLVVEKGSIAVDGISLTVNQSLAGYFEVNIIPHTFKNTTIKSYRLGRRVNLEFDIIAKYINKMNMQTENKSLTKKKLLESGW